MSTNSIIDNNILKQNKRSAYKSLSCDSTSIIAINSLYQDEFYSITGKPIVPITYQHNELYEKLSDTINFTYNALKVSNIITEDEYNNFITDAVNNNSTYLFNYSNSVYSYNYTYNSYYNNIDNNYLLKYEDIVIKNSDDLPIKLEEDTSIREFANIANNNKNANSNINFSDANNYNGAFLYPDLDTINQILTDGGDRSNVLIKPGESISIPITFEYFLSPDCSQSNIKKTLIFCIKDSFMSKEKYYEVEFNGNKSSNIANSIYTSIDNYTLSDSLTTE